MVHKFAPMRSRRGFTVTDLLTAQVIAKLECRAGEMRLRTVRPLNLNEVQAVTAYMQDLESKEATPSLSSARKPPQRETMKVRADVVNG